MRKSLDNLDVLHADIPDNVSISDICTCGRCKRRKPQTFMPKKDLIFPETDYKSTFKEIKDPRPRSNKRPPPTPRPVLPPMVFNTNQREDFQIPKDGQRAEPHIPVQSYKPTSEHFDGKTYYQQEYYPREYVPTFREEPFRDHYKQSSAKFDARTTNKEHFQKWGHHQQMAFSELPSFTGSILYPDRTKFPDSTTRDTFKGEFTERPPAIGLKDANIKLEGPQYHVTTNNDTYKENLGDLRARQPEKKSNLKAGKQEFFSETQFMRDFGRRGRQPSPRKPVDPLQPQIDLTFDRRRCFDTEQRAEFKGHDTTKHPAPGKIKQDSDEYHAPTEKFETETCQKIDYQPHDVSKSYQPRVVQHPSGIDPKKFKFQSATTNKEYFKKWELSPRVRHGDFHENRIYLPPMKKFEAVSTSQECFVEKKAEPALNYKPVAEPISSVGATDFDTMYNVTYKGHEIKPCKARMFLLQEELRKKFNKAQPKSISAH